MIENQSLLVLRCKRQGSSIMIVDVLVALSVESLSACVAYVTVWECTVVDFS